MFSFILLLFISSTSSATQLAPALYVFGDSLMDSGNNNFLQIIIKASYPPYGIDFVNGSTGRFTNGNTVADFIAEFLELPYSPPILSFNPGDSLSLTGLNYASGACGLLPKTGSDFGKCLSFEEQVGLFQETVESMKQPRYFTSSTELSEYLSKSIFLISIGSNDYINNDIVTSSVGANKRYAQLLVHTLSLQLQRLYNLGARKIVLFEIGPVGCVPAISRKNKHSGKCVENRNKLVSYFNSRIPAMLQNLTSSLKGSSFVNGLAYNQAYDAIINPSKYGLVNTNNSCCSTWMVGPAGCLPTVPPCDDRDKYYFWDGYHPTQAAFSLLASQCINNASFCTPFSLKELIQI